MQSTIIINIPVNPATKTLEVKQRKLNEGVVNLIVIKCKLEAKRYAKNLNQPECRIIDNGSCQRKKIIG